MGEAADRATEIGTLPQRIGRYETRRKLRGGAMGDVYLAHDPVIGRRVVLKTVKRELLDMGDRREEFLERFRRECKLLGSVSHPSVVTMYDAGEDEATGLLYMAMEHVEGMDLQSVLTGGARFPFPQVIEMGLELARALEAAHAHGIVHRDVKPSNVLLSIAGRVKLTDFGIAKGTGEEITRRGVVVGTPCYLSPEQIRGAAIDGRSDLFSLGVLLYQLVAGRRPFVSPDPVDMLAEEPPPIRSLAADAPEALGRLIDQMLRKKPEERPASAGIVAQELERLLFGSGDAPTVRVAPATRRLSGAGVLTLVLVLIALAALLWGLLGIAGSGRQEPTPAPTPPTKVAPAHIEPTVPAAKATSPPAPAAPKPSMAPGSRPDYRRPGKGSGPDDEERRRSFEQMEREHREFLEERTESP